MSDDAKTLAARLADCAELVCRHYLPRGQRKGNYWLVGDTSGTKGGSLYVRLAGEKRGRWQDAATGEYGDLLDLIRENCRLTDFRDVLDEARRFLSLPTFAEERATAKHATTGNEPSPDADSARARRIWKEARDLTPSLGERYLRRRLDGRAIPDEVLRGGALRFHPNCPYGPGTRHSCIVALFTDAITAEPRGIHRIALTTAGEKIGKGMALGPKGGCVIRLWPDEDVEQGLVLGEGVETTLAASFFEDDGTLLRPAWAAGSRGNLENFPILAGVESLTLVVDHDANEAGQRAALLCSARWTAAGREVIRLMSKTPGDFNDLLRGAA